MFSTVSHTPEADLCEDRSEVDPAILGIHAPILCEVVETVSAAPHNAAAAYPLTLSGRGVAVV